MNIIQTSDKSTKGGLHYAAQNSNHKITGVHQHNQ